jgi:hypothetical protein
VSSLKKQEKPMSRGSDALRLRLGLRYQYRSWSSEGKDGMNHYWGSTAKCALPLMNDSIIEQVQVPQNWHNH